MAATTLNDKTTAAASLPDAMQFTVVRAASGLHAVTVSVGDLTVLTSRGTARVVAQQTAAVIEAHLCAWPSSDGIDVGDGADGRVDVTESALRGIPAQHP